MRQLGRGIVALLFLAGTLCAGGAGTHEAVVKDTIAQLDQMSATLAGVRDDDSARAARPELKKTADAWRATRAKAEALPPPEPAVKERLAKDYRPKLDASLKKLFGEVLRVQNVAGGPAALQELAGVLNPPPP